MCLVGTHQFAIHLLFVTSHPDSLTQKNTEYARRAKNDDEAKDLLRRIVQERSPPGHLEETCPKQPHNVF